MQQEQFFPSCFNVSNEAGLAALAAACDPQTIRGWSAAEAALIDGIPPISPKALPILKRLVQVGRDPLGEMFCYFRSADERRKSGATYTPASIVASMFDWAETQVTPARVVDPGTGSARFLLEAARRFPNAQIVGFELDPMAALMARANLAIAGQSGRAEIVLGDYRNVTIPQIDGPTLYIGNPPYVRHHLIEPHWKHWLVSEAKKADARASQLAGMHAYFFLATARNAAEGDFGTFVTAAEWLDVNYGVIVRDLFLGRLGGGSLTVIEPTALPFPDTATTAAITCFRIGSRPKSIRMKRVATIDELRVPVGNRLVRRERLEAENRWSHLTRPGRKGPKGYIELGELCRVHRGQVTGSNRVWIAGPHSEDLPPSVLYPTVTKAVELFQSGHVLNDASRLRRVIDIPVDFTDFDRPDRLRIQRFLAFAKAAGAHLSYIAANRKAWWSVGLRQPAPILATYMARRPPAFVENQAQARHINIAHGLYPRQPLSDLVLKRLASYLSTSIQVADGRTYAGGLTKFEPREMERLLVPRLEMLERGEI